MKTKLLKFIFKMSKIAIYGIVALSSIFSFAVSFDSEAQRKSLEDIRVYFVIDDLKLNKAFRVIEGATDFQFAYKQSELPSIRINTNAKGESMADILREISHQSGVSFKRIDGTIHVKTEHIDKQIEEELTSSRVNDIINITGRVVDKLSGEGLPSVAITIKGTSRGTVTDLDGNYTLEANQGDVLVFSYIGFVTQEVAVNNQTQINISLDEDVEALDEVVVVGYGSQTKREVTSSIASISSKDIKEMPIVGIDQSIQGRAAGVVVINNTGEPGGGITMRIRGTTSIGGGNEPLYVIDGIPLENAQTENRNVGEARVNGISHINPSDIESIDILKDAAATAIYGARASNGVVLITTKRGKEGMSEINFDAYTGISQVASRYDLLGASEFASMVNEGLASINQAPVFSDAFIANPTIDNDWQDLVFRNAKVFNANISARGGNQTTGYMISGGYTSQEGTIEGTKFERFSLRANVDHKVNNSIKIGTNLFASVVDQDRQKNDGSAMSADASNFNNIYGAPVLSSALVASPAMPIFDASGEYHRDTLQQAYVNPLRQVNRIEIRNQVVRLIPTFFANISLTKNLLLTSRASADVRSENEEWFNTPNVGGEDIFGGGAGQSSRRTFDLLLWTFDNYITYDFDMGSDHSLSLLAGSSLQRSEYESSFALVSGIITPTIKTLNAGIDTDRIESDVQAWALASFFGRANYNYKQKYLLNVNARYDGSSRFGKENRFGFFPSAALGWRLIEEDFISEIPQITDLKVRVSWGITGNQSIGNYSSRPLFQLGTGTNVGNNYSGLTGATFRSLASNSLSWEETAQTDIGIDASFFNDRLSITADYYVKNTDKLLFQVPLPQASGFTGIVDNVGKVENKGIELSLSSVNFERNGFRWTTSLNIARNENKVLELLGDDDVIQGAAVGYSIARVGEPFSFYLYEREKFVNPDDGTIVLVDQNADSLINEEDLILAGSPLPNFFGGLTNRVEYKNFDLSVFLQFSQGNKIYNLTRRQLELMNVPNNSVIGANSTEAAYQNRWQNPGDVTEYPKLNYDGTNNAFNLPHTGWLEDGSYLRLKTLTIGYNLSQSIAKRLGMIRGRIYLSSNNLLTFTNYKGMDPEVNHYTGVNLGGNSGVAAVAAGLLQGYDWGDYPQAKSYVIGINLTF